MKKLLLAVLLVAFLAMPAFASVQNIKISGDIDSTYVYRERFDLGQDLSNSQDERSSFILTQTRVRIDADLTDNVSATVALINERDWTDPDTSNNTYTSDSTDIDINLAYVTLREMLYSPLTVVIGRQQFHYGNAFIVGTGGTTPLDSGIAMTAYDLSKQHGMDAVRLILDYNPLTIEMLYAKVDENVTTPVTPTGTNRDDIDLYGINATYELGDEMNSVVEAYLFSKKDQTTHTNTAGSKVDHVKTIGIRGSTSPLEGLTVQAEYAHQGGTASVKSGTPTYNRSRNAHAVQAIVDYQLPVLEDYNPVLSYVFTKVTGDDALTVNGVTDDTYAGWDSMFEDQGRPTIFNAIFPLTNCIIHQGAITVNPIEDVTTKLTFTKVWLEKPYQVSGTSVFALLQPDTPTSTQAVTYVKDKKGLGYEIDFAAMYDYTEDVQFGLNVGWFVPGNAFDDRYKESAKQILLNCLVNF